MTMRLLVLGILLCASTAGAQSEAPAAATEAPPGSAPPLPADVARASLELSSLLELQRLQLRENELLQIRQESSIAWPAVGLGVGLPLSLITLPVGAALLATSEPDDEDVSPGYYDDSPDPARRAGGIVLALGVAALVTTICSGVLVARIRRARRATEQELRSIRITRTHILRAFAPPDLPPAP